MAKTKTGGATMASQKERADQEQARGQPLTAISVRIDRLINDPNRSLRAFASANIGDFAVHGITVYEKDGKRWVNMPQNSYTENGEKKYSDVFHPTTAESREQLGKAVLDEYRQHLENVQTAENAPKEAHEAPVQKM